MLFLPLRLRSLTKQKKSTRRENHNCLTNKQFYNKYLLGVSFVFGLRQKCPPPVYSSQSRSPCTNLTTTLFFHFFIDNCFADFSAKELSTPACTYTIRALDKMFLIKITVSSRGSNTDAKISTFFTYSTRYTDLY